MINEQIIDQAIVLHRDWVSRLKQMMINEDHSKISVAVLEDPNICELGRYLALDEVQSSLPSDFFTELNALHNIFHSEAGHAAELIKEHAELEEIEMELEQIDACSQELVTLLIKAKTAGCNSCKAYSII